MKKIITSISYVIATIQCMAATTWYVTKSGSDSNTGKSESTAFLTIQKAVDSSATGDQIIVNDGVYDSISTGNRDITIKSKNGAGKTIIDGKDSSTPFNVGGNIDQIKSVLIGFTLRNGRSPGNYNMGGAARGGTLKNCILTNNFASSNAGGAHFSHMENCLIIACNSCYGYASAAYSCELRNCTVTQNRLDGSLAGGQCALYQCTVYNSIVYDNPCGGIGTGCSAYNCVTTDPLFRDTAHGDYRLQKTSSCIDAGNNSYSTTDTDLAGKARIYNGTVDIGAYEYQPKIPAGIENIVAHQRYPWNGLVDLSFTVTGEATEKYDVSFVAKDVVGNTNLAMVTLLDAKGAALSSTNSVLPGNYNWIWNATADLPDGFMCDRMAITGTAEEHKGLYMVVDLSGGATAERYPVSYLDAVPSGGWTDEYKTTKLVLRRLPAGIFTMGSPVGESGRYSEDEVQHSVTLTKDFYIGVFEVTQKQYSQVMGSNPCSTTGYGKGDTYPVHYVSYNDLRGSSSGAKWPTDATVDESSFMGVLRSRTKIESFDLPTEAQWEYACRAGSTGMFAGDGSIATMGWFSGNAGGSTHIVGGKSANDWGLHDMHGNVQEWTRDWFSHPSSEAVTDPAPDSSRAEGCRVRRGGSWYDGENGCRSADRNHNSIADAWNSFPTHTSNALGFRVGMTCD